MNVSILFLVLLAGEVNNWPNASISMDDMVVNTPANPIQRPIGRPESYHGQPMNVPVVSQVDPSLVKASNRQHLSSSISFDLLTYFSFFIYKE